ncbi:MAG TPA: hypothetical protein VMG31_09230 [Verrucomicrobiae bacterium]|nr:hypothetical protein [Verrucomicrobiae bacterium]
MRSRILKAGSVFMWAGSLVLVLGQFAAAQSWQRGLVGTWHVQVVQIDCQSGVDLGNPFPSLLTFAVGGTMAEDTTNPAFAPGQRGAGQGVWSPKRGTYAARSAAFINFTTPPDPETHNPGFEAGQQTITQVITLKNDHEWTSSAAIEFTDSTGAVYRQGCALASAQRF